MHMNERALPKIYIPDICQSIVVLPIPYLYRVQSSIVVFPTVSSMALYSIFLCRRNNKGFGVRGRATIQGRETSKKRNGPPGWDTEQSDDETPNTRTSRQNRWGMYSSSSVPYLHKCINVGSCSSVTSASSRRHRYACLSCLVGYSVQYFILARDLRDVFPEQPRNSCAIFGGAFEGRHTPFVSRRCR